MAYQMVATAVTLNGLEGHSPVADVFTCNPSNICVAFYTISTDSVFAWFLGISRACCQQLSQKTAIIFQLMQRVARFLCNSRASCISCIRYLKKVFLGYVWQTKQAICQFLSARKYRHHRIVSYHTHGITMQSVLTRHLEQVPRKEAVVHMEEYDHNDKPSVD